MLSGTLTGSGSGHRELVLEETPYPYTRSFTPVGVPVETNAVGAFTFIVRRLSISTEFRITTATAPQLFSPIVTEHVTVRVTLKASARGHSLARLYGLVSPSEVGSEVLLQLVKPAREKTGKALQKTSTYVTLLRTVVKRATKSFSRFSAVLTIARSGEYRAFVLVRRGGLSSGTSPSVSLKSAGEQRKKRK